MRKAEKINGLFVFFKLLIGISKRTTAECIRGKKMNSILTNFVLLTLQSQQIHPVLDHVLDVLPSTLRGITFFYTLKVSTKKLTFTDVLYFIY